ncbi:golgin subfamily A member 4 isoform X2 [Gadus macrocephalus]|uniref:golgin subfamily A member 4 isoform X2 n=1 Tax=Gadus macrocephalus TaxID=80720 RepID=UPI0028CBAAD3|nr:golgin subfamily A member 4 isoform X2 [Gadus macrocephalus]
MFKKLKQKINEEQSPQRNAQSPLQAQQTGPGERRSSHTPSFQQDGTPSPSDREALAGMIAEPAFLSEYTIFALDHSKRPKPAQVASVGASGVVSRSPRGSINGDGSASPQPPRREEPQTFAQKLQLKVPSVEALFRSGASRAEGLFRSPSKESLGRSASRESLTTVGEAEPAAAPGYDPSSDVESEAEDSPGNVESLSREQLLHRLQRSERSLGNYRGKYSELVTAYRTVQRDKEKSQVILSQSQDKALRRIGELREELQMDQLAKKHLQEEFDATLEEKDQLITVLQTQVALMKKRLKGVTDLTVPIEVEVSASEDAANSSAALRTPAKDTDAEAAVGNEGSGDSARVMEVLQKRVTRQENLLLKCKELLRTHKERGAQLGSENETLQEQLQLRLQELEKMKELHTTEKTKLITQLRDAKNLIEQLEQDKGMVIAETKRQMHETLEMKEDEIAQLRTRMQQITSQKEELQEQKEKNEKSAFEELERALGIAQRAEEARKQLQVQLEEQVKEVEREGEEERKSLQQELSRVKQEVVSIMKKSSEDTVANMEKQHNELLAAKEHELTARINQAVEQCKEEFSQAAKEREQQSSLALEDAGLQMTAQKTEAENKVKETQLELEAARTRILELESTLEKSSENGSSQSNDFSKQMKDLRAKHKEQMSALKAKQREQLEKHTDTLTQQHNTALEKLKQDHSLNVEDILKDKELQFHAHVEDMNQKTLEKLDAKQTELEALSSELSEALGVKQLLEERLAALDGSVGSAQQAMEQRLKEEEAKHNAAMADIRQQHEESLGGMEKTLKEELNNLKIAVEEKQRELEERILVEKTLNEKSETALQDLNTKSSELEELRHSLSQAQTAKESLVDSNANLSKITKDLGQCKKQLKQLERKLEVAQADLRKNEETLQRKSKELEEMEQQLQQTKKELSEKEKLHIEETAARYEEEQRLRKGLDDEKATHAEKTASTVKEMEVKLKTQETKMDKIKQKAKEMQEKFKKRLQENEESMKKELSKKEEELQQKEQQVRDKILEMAQKSSHGLSSAMSELQTNHKEELENLHKSHKQEVEDLEHRWQEKLRQQEEDISEKHLHVVQEKALELEDASQQLSTIRVEKDQAVLEINKFKEELVIRETTVQKLQVELKEAAGKLEGLSQSEALLKGQIESMERNLNQALIERNGLQDQLSSTEEESRNKLKALSKKLDSSEGKLKSLKTSKSKQGEDLERKLEESALQIQAKEGDFQKQLLVITNQMEHYCREVQSKVESGSTELYGRVESRVTKLKDQVLCNQKRVGELKNVILTKLDTICTLEEKLRKQTEENMNLCSSIEQLTVQLGTQAENIEALTNERDRLLKEAEGHSQSISQDVRRIEKLSEENKTISENMSANVLHISNLESIIDTLKSQVAGSVTEKEEAIHLQSQRCKEESQQIVANMRETIEKLEQEKKSAVEQADTLRNSLSEFKHNAESKFTQNHNTVVSLQDRLRDLEREISEKNEALQRLTTNIDNQSISKSEMDQALSEKEQRVSALASELESCNGRLCELQDQLALKMKECEQLSADLKQQLSDREREKREFTEQLQQIQEQFTHNSHLFQETEGKLHILEKENHTCKSELEAQRVEFEKMRSEMQKSKEQSLKDAEEKLSAESVKKMADLKKKAEQKIGQLKKQLTSQLEEKEQMVQSLKSSLEEINEREAGSKRHTETLEEQGRNLEDALGKLKEDHEKRLEESLSEQRLENVKSLEELKRVYEGKISLLQRDETAAPDAKADETPSKLEELGERLHEAEEQNRNLVAEIGRLKEELLEREAWLKQQQVAMVSLEKQTLVQQEEVVRMEQSSAVQAPRPETTDQRDEDGESLESLKEKLTEVKNEKLKIHKDFTRLQKDFRSLRREHEQDLEHLKKELAEESDKNLKLELEDLEIKQNYSLKQLMRDFNTQMALKEKEIELTVKETIGKAQCVEAELITSNREEVSQLHKLIAQKDDDLQRTVQKYEQVLQSREDEMGDRVWQVQKELEDLQTRVGGADSEMSIEELQAQLSERNTLLSEARLKEQEFVDRIHSLEDTMRCLHKKAVVTHLGNPCKDPGYSSTDALSEPTEFEYLRKVLFEYMMGRETKTMAKVLTSVLKFPPEQVQSVLEKEESKALPWLR